MKGESATSSSSVDLAPTPSDNTEFIVPHQPDNPTATATETPDIPEVAA